MQHFFKLCLKNFVFHIVHVLHHEISSLKMLDTKMEIPENILNGPFPNLGKFLILYLLKITILITIFLSWSMPS